MITFSAENFYPQPPIPPLVSPYPSEAHPVVETVGRCWQQGPCLGPQNEHFLFPRRGQLGGSQRRGTGQLLLLDVFLWSTLCSSLVFTAEPGSEGVRLQKCVAGPRGRSWGLRRPLLSRESRMSGDPACGLEDACGLT